MLLICILSAAALQQPSGPAGHRQQLSRRAAGFSLLSVAFPLGAKAFDIPGLGSVDVPLPSLPTEMPSMPSLPTGMPSLPSLPSLPDFSGGSNAEDAAAAAAAAEAEKQERLALMMRVRKERLAEEGRKQSEEYVRRQAIVGAQSFGSTVSVPNTPESSSPESQQEPVQEWVIGSSGDE